MNEASDLCFINRGATTRLLKIRIADPNPILHDIEVRVETSGGRATFGISSETLTTVGSGDEVHIRFCPNECATEGTVRLTAWIKGYPDVSSTMELKVPLKPDPWRWVIFEATDQCEDSSRAYLLIHVLQPPRVGDTEVWVRRGENLEHTLAECL